MFDSEPNTVARCYTEQRAVFYKQIFLDTLVFEPLICVLKLELAFQSFLSAFLHSHFRTFIGVLSLNVHFGAFIHVLL